MSDIPDETPNEDDDPNLNEKEKLQIKINQLENKPSRTPEEEELKELKRQLEELNKKENPNPRERMNELNLF